MKRTIILLAFMIAIVAGVNAQNTEKKDLTRKYRWSAEAGFDLAGLNNYGFEGTANYYAFQNKWFKVGPSLQAIYFFSPQKPWGTNHGSGLMSEVHINLMPNMEFEPFKKYTFFVGIDPYIGWQLISTKGHITNESLNIDKEYKDAVNIFNYGGRFKLGGYFGKQKRYGLQTQFQFSFRGLTDDDPMTKFFMLDYPDYKSFVGVNFIYRIK